MLNGVGCRQQRPFRFEQMWMNEKGCGNTIEVVWKENNEELWEQKILNLYIYIHTCGKELTKWRKQNFGNVRRELEKKIKLFEKAEKLAMNGGNAS